MSTDVATLMDGRSKSIIHKTTRCTHVVKVRLAPNPTVRISITSRIAGTHLVPSSDFSQRIAVAAQAVTRPSTKFISLCS